MTSKSSLQKWAGEDDEAEEEWIVNQINDIHNDNVRGVCLQEWITSKSALQKWPGEDDEAEE